jgi:hypothetical protein
MIGQRYPVKIAVTAPAEVEEALLGIRALVNGLSPRDFRFDAVEDKGPDRVLPVTPFTPS